MNRTILLIATVSIIALFGLLMVVYNITSTNAPAVVYTEAQTINATDHITWAPQKKAVLVEYGDFQCPACKAFHDVIKSQIANTDIPKKVTFVFRHYPLPQHAYAMDAAKAAEAAGKQGKFFEMGDLLFQTQEQWSTGKDVKEYFVNLAQQLQLNIDQFKKDVEDPAIAQKITNDRQQGSDLTVGSTPTFFLNGKKLEITSFNEFKDTLSQAAK